jgi:uncharacterized protein HemX
MNAAQRSAGSYPSPTKAVIPSRAAIDKSSSSAGTSPTIVALAILCGVLGLALGVTLFLLLARRRNRRVIEAHLDAERAQRARAESELESEPTNPTVPPLVSEMKKQMGAYNLPPYSPGSK